MTGLGRQCRTGWRRLTAERRQGVIGRAAETPCPSLPAIVVTRSGETDVMTLKAESASPTEALKSELSATLRAVAKLGGSVELVGAGSLPNDGKIISDERS